MQHPSLALDLVRAVTGLKLGEVASAELTSADVSETASAQRLADGVVLAKDEHGRNVFAVIIEAQGRNAFTKKYSWPAYLCSIRSRNKCDALLLVTAMAGSAWCLRRPVRYPTPTARHA